MLERFYLNQELISNTSVFLEETEEHHLSKVLRIREGETVELINGKGSCARARVQKLKLFILEVKNCSKEKEILLGIPFMRPSKLEWILEKGTEIGVSSFFLYPADTSTLKTLSNHQIQRFHSILISSIKQSKRLFLPHLEILQNIKEILAKDAVFYFGDVREEAPFLIPKEEKAIFITGPESGFSNTEVFLLEKKARGIRLNPNVLRAETAPIVASCLIALHAHL